MSLRNARISLKLYAVVAIACLGLAAVAGAALIGAQRMSVAGQALYADALPGFEQGAQLAMLFEQARGAVSRTPAELDLARQEANRKSFAAHAESIRTTLKTLEGSADLATRTLVVGLRDDLALLDASATKVFDYAADFAQDQAVEMLNGEYATVDARIVQSTEKVLAAKRQVAADAARALSDAHRLLMIFVAASAGLAGLLTLGASIVLVRHVTARINRLNHSMRSLADSDLSVEVRGADDRDEIGGMAKAVQVFKDNIVRQQALEAETKAQQEAREARAKRIEDLTRDFDTSVGAIVNTVSATATEMQMTAGSMTATAEETSRQSTAVAAASEEASTNVQTVASAAEELASSVAEISRQVSQSSSISGKAVSEAERTNGLVKGLVEAAQKIGAVTSLINEIASQTNLLALNATIEAARAGEAGKGFAVVASEVKSLANQTAKATEEIGAQIAAMQAATGETVAAIGSIGATIAQINEIATAIAAAVEEQGAATQEIARNVQQAAAGTQEVSGNITGVTKAAGETGAAASQVLGAAGALSRQAEQLRGQVDTFLAAVRAA